MNKRKLKKRNINRIKYLIPIWEDYEAYCEHLMLGGLGGDGHKLFGCSFDEFKVVRI